MNSALGSAGQNRRVGINRIGKAQSGGITRHARGRRGRLREGARGRGVCLGRVGAVEAEPTYRLLEAMGSLEGECEPLALRRVNLIVGTTNNHAPIAMSIHKAAHGLIRKGAEITDGLLNRIEMAFRAYDPCFACATHSLPGEMPLEVQVFGHDGVLLQSRKRGT